MPCLVDAAVDASQIHHEVLAYFAVGLVAFYVVMVGIASSGHIKDRLRKMFGGNKHPN